MKPVTLRTAATRDIEDAFDYYLSEASEAVALRFAAALESAVSGISARPAAGSPRYAHELDLPGLRALSLKRFPHLVFYIELDARIEVWRVLHGARDIPAWMTLAPDT